MFVLAHPGHWLTSLIYLVPVIAVVIFVAVNSFRDRRRGRDRDAEDLAREPTLDDILNGRG